ncbi:hypothetical protein JHK85_020887 [Glycine max]|nr:hypothetical protein JHK85_020887 [Glycine max]KHN16558.1 hypothetical protein glysoja_002655 [Glycine soja]
MRLNQRPRLQATKATSTTNKCIKRNTATQKPIPYPTLNLCFCLNLPILIFFYFYFLFVPLLSLGPGPLQKTNRVQRVFGNALSEKARVCKRRMRV